MEGIVHDGEKFQGKMLFFGRVINMTIEKIDKPYGAAGETSDQRHFSPSYRRQGCKE